MAYLNGDKGNREKHFSPDLYCIQNIRYIFTSILPLLPSSNSTPNSISTPTQLNLHFKSIQLLQELSWSYALYLVFTTTTTHPPTILLF